MTRARCLISRFRLVWQVDLIFLTDDMHKLILGPSSPFAYSPSLHSSHARRDRVAPLPPCRLYGAAMRRAPLLGLGVQLTLPCGWNNAGQPLSTARELDEPKSGREGFVRAAERGCASPTRYRYSALPCTVAANGPEIRGRLHLISR